jgi:hypothetical protein
MRGHGGIDTRGVLVSIVALLALVAGCAGPSSRISDSQAREGVSALPAARELGGTWRGSYGQLGAVLYEDEADCTLRIKEDGTFTVKCARSQLGTNNLAKASSWSGRVVTKGNRVILQDTDGPWPWIVLTRSGNNTLYGVTLDPLVEATVMMEFEREPSTPAGAGGNSP